MTFGLSKIVTFENGSNHSVFKTNKLYEELGIFDVITFVECLLAL